MLWIELPENVDGVELYHMGLERGAPFFRAKLMPLLKDLPISSVFQQPLNLIRGLKVVTRSWVVLPFD